MKRMIPALLVGMAMLLASQAPAQQPAVAKTHLKVGEVAPDFTMLNQTWKPVKLSDYRGKKNVILAFYVLAFTGG